MLGLIGLWHQPPDTVASKAIYMQVGPFSGTKRRKKLGYVPPVYTMAPIRLPAEVDGSLVVVHNITNVSIDI